MIGIPALSYPLYPIHIYIYTYAHIHTHMQMLPEVLEGIEDMTEQVCQCVANVLLTCC